MIRTSLEARCVLTPCVVLSGLRQGHGVRAGGVAELFCIVGHGLPDGFGYVGFGGERCGLGEGCHHRGGDGLVGFGDESFQACCGVAREACSGGVAGLDQLDLDVEGSEFEG